MHRQIIEYSTVVASHLSNKQLFLLVHAGIWFTSIKKKIITQPAEVGENMTFFAMISLLLYNPMKVQVIYLSFTY